MCCAVFELFIELLHAPAVRIHICFIVGSLRVVRVRARCVVYGAP